MRIFISLDLDAKTIAGLDNLEFIDDFFHGTISNLGYILTIARQPPNEIRLDAALLQQHARPGPRQGVNLRRRSLSFADHDNI